MSAATVHRWRLGAASLALIALAFVQDPGRIVNDTKIDLVLDPGSFLSRATSLWDPNGSFGQVQNQAYGYLFPMGPFFWLGDLAGLPGWVVQRGWWSLLLVVAFLGIVKLCSVLDLGSPTARILGGLAFALSPRMLTVIGPSSIEVWPAAVAPWVLVPLVLGLCHRDPRRMALVSALLVAAIGGVNAAATAAVLPLGALLLLLASPGPRRRALLIWWPVATILATVWWTVPLVLLGRYSPPFLDFIESASTTTFAATAFDGLRGTTNWLPYLDSTQSAGFDLVSDSVLIANSVIVLTLGLWGLSRRDHPWRAWLLAGVFAGLVLVTLGHLGSGGWGAASLQSLLDGALAPLRNTHKFDVVVRIPLVLGLVHAVTILTSSPATGGPGPRARGPVVLAAVALLGAAVPAWTTDLARQGSFEATPGYWNDAIDWLDTQADSQNTLMLPGSAFGDYLWGRPRDEPIQALGETPWSVRNAVPLTPPGAIRTLDAFEQAFATGRGSPALTAMLERSGIRYLLVRSDLGAPGATDPELVFSTLASTPGISSVASFGPDVGSPATQSAGSQVVYVNGGLQSQHPAVEIFEVDGADGASVRSGNPDEVPALAGSPAGVLAAGGLFDADTDLLLAQDVPDGLVPGRTILTDTDRRQEVAFGRVPNGRSATLTRDDPYRIDRPVHDYLSDGQDRWKTVATLLGADSIIASSSVSDVTESTIDPSGHPWAAFDDDSTTAWRSADLDGWIEIAYGRPVDLAGASLRLPASAGTRRVAIETDEGTTSIRAVGGSNVPLGVQASTETLRISLPEPSLEALSVAEIDVPEAPVARPLTLPVVPRSWGNPTDVLLTTAEGPATCRRVEDVSRCVAGVDGRGEDGSTIDRIVTLEAPARFAAGLTVLPVQSGTLVDLLSPGIGLRVTSSASTDPVAGPLAMIDGDDGTGWVAALSDRTPTVTVDLGGRTSLDRLVLRTDLSLAASAPSRVSLRFDDGSTQEAAVDPQGRLTFDEVRSRSVSVRIDRAYVRSTLAFDGSGSGLPVGISEISVPGTDIDPSDGADAIVELPCGSGPTVQVGEQRLESAVNASRRAVTAGADLSARVCGGEDAALEFGGNRIIVDPSPAFRPVALRLTQSSAVASLTTAAPLDRSGDTAFSAELPPGGSERLVSVPQTVNQGWEARRAMPVTVNGWMQGWITDSERLDASFTPNGLYRGSLLLGALLVLAVAVAARRASPVDVDRTSREQRSGLRAALLGLGVLTAAAMIAGLAGLIVVGAGCLVVQVAGHRRSELLLAAGILGAGSAYVMRPWTDTSGWAGELDWPQWLVLGALGVAVGLGREPGTRTLRNLMAGRSTTK